jgi:dynactin complex subunit
VNEQGIALALGLLGAGSLGAILKAIVDWYLGRGDTRAKREDAHAAANDVLASNLRDELRRENIVLRERLAKLEGRTDELSITNAALRDENTKLIRQNAQQAEQILHMQKEIDILRSDLNKQNGSI